MDEGASHVPMTPPTRPRTNRVIRDRDRIFGVLIILGERHVLRLVRDLVRRSASTSDEREARRVNP